MAEAFLVEEMRRDSKVVAESVCGRTVWSPGCGCERECFIVPQVR